LKLIDEKTGILNTHNIPYGSSIFVKDGQSVEKVKLFCKWDPYNGVISEFTGKIALRRFSKVNHSWLKLMSKLVSKKKY
jgi:hypothetical protein